MPIARRFFLTRTAALISAAALPLAPLRGWAVTTMTTVGFGDITPKTDLGRFISSLMMLLGWGVLAVLSLGVLWWLAIRRVREVAKAARCEAPRDAAVRAGRPGDERPAVYVHHDPRRVRTEHPWRGQVRRPATRWSYRCRRAQAWSS